MRRRALGAIGVVALAAAAGCAGVVERPAWLGGAPPPAWELPPPPPEERPVTRDGALTRLALDNGLRVIVHEDRRLPRVAVGLTLGRGAALEDPAQAGAVSFMAELLERGAGARDALAFAEAVDSLGARFGAGADWDSVTVSIAGLSRDFDTLLDLLADAALRPRFDAREAERARGARLAALERAKDDPGTLVSWHGAHAIYGAHRFGLPVNGTLESVAELDADAARAVHARLFVPGAAILSISGDVDPDAAIAALRDRFGAWPAGEVPAPGAPPPDPAPDRRTIRLVDRPDLVQARLLVGHDGIERTADDRLAVSLLNLVLGGSGFSSRLTTTLRADRGLTYGVGSRFSLRRVAGPFSASTFTEVEQIRLVIDLLLAELERARSEPPAEDELGWARTLATGSFSMGLETSDAVTAALVDLEVYGLPEDSLDTYRSRIRAVSAAQVAEAAARHLHPERAAIVVVGPAEAILPQLEGLGPVEVVEP